VTGKLEFYGSAPTTKFTRLTAQALVGDNTIDVQEVAGWKVGDEISIAVTEFAYKEHEQFTITNIVGKKVYLNSTIKHFHYGSAKETVNTKGTANINIDPKFQGSLDMRATVSHLSRNIKIIGTTVKKKKDLIFKLFYLTFFFLGGLMGCPRPRLPLVL
jgi:hypothetical protein